MTEDPAKIAEKNVSRAQAADSLQRSEGDAGCADPGDRAVAFDLLALAHVVWRGRWLVVVVTAAFSLASIAYALLATEWYEAEVLLAPTDARSMDGLSSQFGGLASLAGIDLDSQGTAEPIAALRSRMFVREFIEERNLLPVLYAEEWDSENSRWASDDPDERPDIRDAVRLFREDILRVSEDSKTGLVTVGVEWTDAETAVDWASALVERLNARMRQRALEEAEKNVEYLRSELKDVNVVAIQQSIGRLLETELQKMMLAKGNEEFSFRVIDPATPPKYRSRPKRTLLVITSTLLGGMLGVFAVILRRRLQA